MKKLTFSMSVFPNLATALNVFSGFISVIYAAEHNFKLAAIFIFVAAFFDLLDGIIARILKTSSKLGVELDSLADVISFGFAPSFLIYKVYLINYDLIGLIISSFILLFGAFRLARFNVQLENIKTKLDFSGLPVPVAAVTISSIVLFFYNGVNLITPFSYIVIPVVLILSFLMISKIRYNTLPKIKYLTLSAKIVVISISLAALIAIVLTKGVAFFYLVSFHIIFGVLRYLYLLVFRDSNPVDYKQKTSAG
ncbi:MAG: CDP-diacylglycerol--serine O-phosphatidyltransferase [Melioribacteraceae bacterium]|nr:CDP-diacylglycerol--serine O-phosphatidyltransferase [Melioribacteraceae bacterium]